MAYFWVGLIGRTVTQLMDGKGKAPPPGGRKWLVGLDILDIVPLPHAIAPDEFLNQFNDQSDADRRNTGLVRHDNTGG